MTEALTLADTYALNPMDGKQSSDMGNLTGSFKTQRLTNWHDKTNVLIQYTPTLNFNMPILATGDCTPDPTGEFVALNGEETLPTFWKNNNGYYLWYKSGTGWIVSDCIRDISNPYWSKAGLLPNGDYTPQNGASGTLTITPQFSDSYKISGTLTPDITGTYTNAGAYGPFPYFERDDSAYVLWFDGFWWTITEGILSYATEFRGIPFLIQPAYDYEAFTASTGYANIREVPP